MNQKNEINRKDRRRAAVKVNGKEQNILKFLAKRANDLPIMEDRKTGERVNHVHNLREVYMSKGIPGVNEYVARVNAVILRDTSPKFHIRLHGWALVKWFKIMGWLKR